MPINEQELEQILRKAVWFRRLIRPIHPTDGTIRLPDLEKAKGLRIPALTSDPTSVGDDVLWQRSDLQEARYRQNSKTYTIISSILLASYEDTDDQDAERNITGVAGTHYQVSQGFKPAFTDTVGSVTLYMRKQGNPLDTCRVSLWTNTSTEPNTVILSSAQVQGQEISTSLGWVRFTFASPISVTAGTIYHIVLTRLGVLDATNYYVWGIDESSPTYADGLVNYRSAIGGAWTEASPTEDALFQVWSPGAGGAAAAPAFRALVEADISDLDHLTGAEAIAAVEGEATLDLTGDVTMADQLAVSASISASGILNLEPTLTQESGTINVIRNLPVIDPAANSSATFRGMFLSMVIADGCGFDFTGRLVGIEGKSRHRGEGTLAKLWGSNSVLRSDAGSTVTECIHHKLDVELLQGTITNHYGLFVEAIDKGGTLNRAIYSAGGDSVHAGNLRVGSTTAPTDVLSLTLATEDLDIVDAGSAGATEQDWIEVKVGGNTGYIRVFAAV